MNGNYARCVAYLTFRLWNSVTSALLHFLLYRPNCSTLLQEFHISRRHISHELSSQENSATPRRNCLLVLSFTFSRSTESGFLVAVPPPPPPLIFILQVTLENASFDGTLLFPRHDTRSYPRVAAGFFAANCFDGSSDSSRLNKIQASFPREKTAPRRSTEINLLVSLCSFFLIIER